MGHQRNAIRLDKFCENETLVLQITFEALWFRAPITHKKERAPITCREKERVPRQVNAETKVSQLFNDKDATKLGSSVFFLLQQNTKLGPKQEQSQVTNTKSTYSHHFWSSPRPSTHSCLTATSQLRVQGHVSQERVVETCVEGEAEKHEQRILIYGRLSTHSPGF